MALPTRRAFWPVDSFRPQVRYGNVLRIVPGNATQYLELDRAPDSAGVPGTWATIAVLDPLPKQGAFYTDYLYPTTSAFWYRVRHSGPDITAGSYLQIAAAIAPRRLDDLADLAQLITASSFTRTEDLNAGAVTTPKLTDDAVTNPKVADNAIDTLQLVASAVTSPKIQDSGVEPMPVTTSPFSYSTGGPGAAQMWVAWTWSAFTVYRLDGTTLSIGAASGMATPPSPTLSEVAGGALGARTRYVRIGYVRDGKVYRVGAEASLAINANNLLKVTAPSSVAGYTGWCVLVGSSASGERFQVTSLSSPLAFGSDWTEPVGGADVTGKTPYHTDMNNAVTEIALDPSTTYYWMPFWHVTDQFVNLYSAFTSDTPANAIQPMQDGRIPLALRVSGSSLKTSMSALTPGGGSTGSGTGGGKF